jgi:hypothetical protein
MLDYTLEPEERIREGGLKGGKDTILILAREEQGSTGTRPALRALLFPARAAGIARRIAAQRWRHPSSNSRNSALSRQ